MEIVIFCGGAGTRLREETESRPKPMVTLRDLQRLEKLWNDGKAGWKIWS